MHKTDHKSANKEGRETDTRLYKFGTIPKEKVRVKNAPIRLSVPFGSTFHGFRFSYPRHWPSQESSQAVGYKHSHSLTELAGGWQQWICISFKNNALSCRFASRICEFIVERISDFPSFVGVSYRSSDKAWLLSNCRGFSGGCRAHGAGCHSSPISLPTF